MVAGAIAIPGLAELQKKGAAKNRLHASRPSRSVLVRGHGAADKAKGAAKEVKGAKAAAKGGVGSEVAKAKKLAAPAKAGAGKDLAAVKKSLAGHKAAGLKATGPARSVMVRDKGLAGAKLKGTAKEVHAAKAAAKGGVGSEVAKAKKLAAPAKAGAGKDLAAVKKSLAGHKAAGLKATGPARSVMVRDKGLAGKNLRSAKAGLGGRLGGLKQLKKTAGASKPLKSLGKAASVAQKAQPHAGKAVQMGRLLRSI